MSKMDRQGARTPADLERKYQFGKQFSEIMGLVNDARDAAYSVESELSDKILELHTSLTRSAEEMVFTALKAYTKTEDLEQIEKTLRSEMSASAEGIKGLVSAAESTIKKVDDDLQTKYNLITKYFTFDINGLLIGALNDDGSPSPNKVIIDNDEIIIMVGNNEVMKFDAFGNAKIPSLTIGTMFSFLGLKWTEDETHINCDYVG